MQLNYDPVTAMRRAKGVTLLELLVVTVIIGILAAIAIPSYTDYVRRSNRSAAQSYLIDLALAEGQYLVDTRTYTLTKSDLRVAEPARVTQYYNVTIDNVSNTAPQTFRITATPTGTQVPDGTLTIDQAGEKLPNGKW